MKKPDNLEIIQSTDHDEIAEELKFIAIAEAFKAPAFHVTNGTYAYPVEKIASTMLGGFQYLAENEASLKDIFMIAVNSDESMKNFSNKTDYESQLDRAMKVAGPLAAQHPDRKVVVVYYDDETPRELYNRLAQQRGVYLQTLHKWGGYGAEDGAPVIEGAESFERSYAFPYFDKDAKPYCFNETRRGAKSDNTRVVNLFETQGRHGDAYLAKDGKNTPLFPVAKP